MWAHKNCCNRLAILVNNIFLLQFFTLALCYQPGKGIRRKEEGVRRGRDYVGVNYFLYNLSLICE